MNEDIAYVSDYFNAGLGVGDYSKDMIFFYNKETLRYSAWVEEDIHLVYYVEIGLSTDDTTFKVSTPLTGVM